MADQYNIDSHKLIYHPERVAQLLQAGSDWEKAKDVYPIYLELTPVGACNHRCIFCCVDYIGYKANRLSIDLMRERLPELSRLGVKAIMYAGEGEPLLHKNVSELIRLTREAGIDVSVTTNASVMPKDFLDEALPHISWLKASVNAGTAETYAKVHQTEPGDFHKAQEHLTAMVRRRREKDLDCVIGVQTLVLPENVHEIAILAETCRDKMKVDYLVVKPYSQHLSSGNTIHKDIDYTEWLSLGNINDQTFEEIWTGEKRRRRDKACDPPSPAYNRPWAENCAAVPG